MAELAGDRIARVVTLLAEADAPAVFHCAAGKDRTGVISAIVLGLLGVPDEVIVADYAATRENLDAIVDRLNALEGYRTMLAALPPDTMHANPETIVEFLERLRARFGSVEDYAQASGVAAPATRAPASPTDRGLSSAHSLTPLPHRQVGEHLRRGGGARLDAERREDRLQVPGDGVRADLQDRGDLAVRLPLREPREHLGLAPCEPEGFEGTWRDPGEPFPKHQEAAIGFRERPDLEPATVSLDDERLPWRGRSSSGGPRMRGEPSREGVRKAVMPHRVRREVDGELLAGARIHVRRAAPAAHDDDADVQRLGRPLQVAALRIDALERLRVLMRLGHVQPHQVEDEPIALAEVAAPPVERDPDQAGAAPGQRHRELVLDAGGAEELLVEPQATVRAGAKKSDSFTALPSPERSKCARIGWSSRMRAKRRGPSGNRSCGLAIASACGLSV